MCFWYPLHNWMQDWWNYLFDGKEKKKEVDHRQITALPGNLKSRILFQPVRYQLRECTPNEKISSVHYLWVNESMSQRVTSRESMSQWVSAVNQTTKWKLKFQRVLRPNHWNEGLGLINKLLLYWLWVSLTHDSRLIDSLIYWLIKHGTSKKSYLSEILI